ncbi:hypothetical protein ACKQTC_02550 [Peptococcus simiae]|uniref:Uncharacterized protein n=1 Tax=Peptococcus simiae TaxID=1643805 RepID=A0ABW9GXA3_9FIRM
MADRIESYKSPQALLEGLQAFLTEEGEGLTHVNYRVLIKDGRETPWLFNARLEYDAEGWQVVSLESGQVLWAGPSAAIVAFKIRPYYRARCIGFKNILFTLLSPEEAE